MGWGGAPTGLVHAAQEFRFFRVFEFWVGISTFYKMKENGGTSLVAQWLRIHLPMQGTQV